MTLDLKRENVSPPGGALISLDVEKRYRRKFAHEYELYESIR